ncbi:transglycosylase domain-containing protein [Brochothrix campestris]|uniref:Penicillin-binding protein n=1 Tax=Brochothrix campestris FSL F6-1037 TaxID=1265861 RepID=W7CZC1_9LIST|nr:PBP1A family penicillin-binding protein [Brochothrix campestris]EUJ38353.1 penicillin-binding protein [Brochothrix campestris FSL F6-1037]
MNKLIFLNMNNITRKWVLFWQKYYVTKIVIITILTVVFLTILYFTFMAKQANVNGLKAALETTTGLYDKDSDKATEVSSRNATFVKIDKISPNIKNGLISIEDRRFYTHNGFDIRGMARGVVGLLTTGHITGGGSTITQQLAKNALLTDKQTLKRKVEELFLAAEIENKYTKDEILEMYLNTVYFGNGEWGIENASQKYFNKAAKDVSIEEGALLAGLVQLPSSYDPTKYIEKATTRRDQVLKAELENEKITQEQYDTVIKQAIVLNTKETTTAQTKYPFYTDAVLNEAINNYGLSQDDLLTKGYKIYTMMDQNLQTAMETVYNNDYNFPSDMNGEMVQSGGVMMEPKSGGIYALVGGRGEHVFRGFNRATQLRTQVGSTMKPLAVYVPALEEGFETTDQLQDKFTDFNGYKPTNIGGVYQGKMPMYEAVQNSINLPAVWLLKKIGLNTGVKSVERFGLSVAKADENLSLALGGTKTGYSPMTMARAYATFSNEGKLPEKGHLIRKIVDASGRIIVDNEETTSKKIISETVSKDMTSMLLDVVKSGTGQGAGVPGYDIAAKTGSTQVDWTTDGTKDQWFVGYTPNVVLSMWMGFDNTDEEHYLQTDSSSGVVSVAGKILSQSLPQMKNESFDIESAATAEQERQTTKETEEKGIFDSVKDTADSVGSGIKKGAQKTKDFFNYFFGN